MSNLLHSGLIWYLSRGTGVLLVAVLTLSTALGVLAMRGGSTRWPWFGVDLLSYASWALGLAHGLLIGTDAWTTWNLAVTGASVAVVLAAVVVRLLPRGAPRPAVRPAPLPDLRQDADPVAPRSRRPA